MGEDTLDMRTFGNRWHRWEPPGGMHPEWRKRRFLFFRFARVLAGALLLFLIGMAGLAYLFTRLMNGGGQAALAVWLAGCGLAIAFPLLAVVIGIRSFARIANPLARLMTAADAVAEGDFSVRVPEMGSGEFRRLESSFNRMVSELERSSQLRRNLTADVAHELRTPLHIMQGNLEGILDGVYQASPAQVGLLLDQTRQLTRLVEDLRTLSLAEAGQLSLKQEPVNVVELLKDVATSFSGQAEAAGIELRNEAQSTSGSLVVMGDAGRLDQVLSNLIANALRHTHPGGMITMRAVSQAGQVCIQVIDNGAGIAPEDLPFIFERFWSTDKASSNARNKGGSGLGLAIARQLVQAQGGQIRVESQPEQGTIFSIDLPVIDQTNHFI
jgi:two-component system sensor histidine kinase BaeS